MIILKGMDMPTKCNDCFCWNCQHDNQGYEPRPHACPLVAVPAPVRLIAECDAIKTAWMILEGLGYRRDVNPQLEQAVQETFATAPAFEEDPT